MNDLTYGNLENNVEKVNDHPISNPLVIVSVRRSGFSQDRIILEGDTIPNDLHLEMAWFRFFVMLWMLAYPYVLATVHLGPRRAGQQCTFRLIVITSLRLK